MKRLSLFAFMAALLTLSMAGCKGSNDIKNPDGKKKALVILYENDVHCGIDGYTKIAGLRNLINASDTANCIIVSSGDFIQGGAYGALTKGRQIIDIMNSVGYSAVTIGNHEFDYSADSLFSLMNRFNAAVTCTNFSDMSGKQYYAPYVMTTIGNKKVAFVGIVTPTTIETEGYSFYDKDGKQLYDLHPDECYELVQKAANMARENGADYVVCLSHLGEQHETWNSLDMVSKTNGIDVVLDGHTHSVIPDSMVANKDGKLIPVTQTGTQFANIGKLWIGKNGQCVTELIPATTLTCNDSRVDAVVDSIKQVNASIMNEVVGTCPFELTINGADGNRLVRKGETNLGNLVADGLRAFGNAQIGVVNGGGVRKSIPAGTITFGDLLNVQPFFNEIKVKRIKGSVLKTMLDVSYKGVPAEDGAFLQISGMKVTIDLTSGKPVVSDVKVLNAETGTYYPLDEDALYTVCTSGYVFTTVTAELTATNAEDVTPEYIEDVQLTKRYITNVLHGTVGSEYATPQGRITIVK